MPIKKEAHIAKYVVRSAEYARRLENTAIKGVRYFLCPECGKKFGVEGCKKCKNWLRNLAVGYRTGIDKMIESNKPVMLKCIRTVRGVFE